MAKSELKIRKLSSGGRRGREATFSGKAVDNLLSLVREVGSAKTASEVLGATRGDNVKLREKHGFSEPVTASYSTILSTVRRYNEANPTKAFTPKRGKVAQYAKREDGKGYMEVGQEEAARRFGVKIGADELVRVELAWLEAEKAGKKAAKKTAKASQAA